MKAIEVRKQLLIAEAEVLRNGLVNDLEVIHLGWKILGTQAKSIASVASVAATVAAGFSAVRNASKTGTPGRPSLMTELFAGARTAAAVWLALRSRK